MEGLLMAPRIKIHKDGRATMAGLNYDDLRSILTAAWLNNNESLRKANEDPESLGWYATQLKLIDLARASLNAAIARTFPPRPPPTKAQRLASIRAAIAERKLLEELLDSVCRPKEAR
jgi:hypothetical protein